jgi:hypothetical protein
MPAGTPKKKKKPAAGPPQYEFRGGFRSSVAAKTIALRLEYLRVTLCRWPAPRDILDDARHPDSPIHGHFDWSDTVAAEKWRLQQAAQLVTAVRVRTIDPGEGVASQFQPAYHSTSGDEGGKVFVRFQDAVLPDRRPQTLREVVQRIWMSTLRERTMGFHELDALYALVDALKKKHCDK